jgi:hypothetical protein
MNRIRRRTIALPDRVTVTVLRLPDGCTTDLLREMLSASLYVLAGPTTGPSGEDTGFGAYVGISTALNDRVSRCGVSLHNWSYRQGRLRPEVLVLVNRTGRPVDPQALLLIEATLARSISRHHTVLNTRTSAPRAYRGTSRHQRLWAEQTSLRLVGLLQGQVFHHHPGRPAGGSAREQLVRCVRAANRPLDIDELLTIAHRAGIAVPGRTPRQRTRRDVTTRERRGAVGQPRLFRTHVGGRTIVWPAGTMSVRQARAHYRAAHPEAAPPPCRKRR